MAACHKCGRSAIGRASDGNHYCERPECCQWKVELQKHRSKEARLEREVLFLHRTLKRIERIAEQDSTALRATVHGGGR